MIALTPQAVTIDVNHDARTVPREGVDIVATPPQRWSIVLALVVAIAAVVGFNIGGGPLPIVMLPLSAVMWGLQFVLTAVLLGTYAMRTSRTL